MLFGGEAEDKRTKGALVGGERALGEQGMDTSSQEKENGHKFDPRSISNGTCYRKFNCKQKKRG